MAAQPATYDLMLLLSTEASEQQRTKVLTDVESAITAGGGSIERNEARQARAERFFRSGGAVEGTTERAADRGADDQQVGGRDAAVAVEVEAAGQVGA